MLADDTGGLVPPEIICEVCTRRGTPEVAQSILITATRNFYYCGSCRSWLWSEINHPLITRQIRDIKLTTALNYYCLGQMELATPLLPEIIRALRLLYYKLQDFLVAVYGTHDR